MVVNRPVLCELEAHYGCFAGSEEGFDTCYKVVEARFEHFGDHITCDDGGDCGGEAPCDAVSVEQEDECEDANFDDEGEVAFALHLFSHGAESVSDYERVDDWFHGCVDD